MQLFRKVGLFLIIVGIGCSGSKKTVKVEGVVKVDGNPTPGVVVQFISQEKDGHDANGLTDSNGVFQLTTFNTNDGALRGSYKVIITKAKATGDAVTGVNPSDQDSMRKAMQQGMVGKAQDRNGKVSKSELPEVYSKAETTPLKYQIPSDGKIEIEISSKVAK
jgi:hypothetical protein